MNSNCFNLSGTSWKTFCYQNFFIPFTVWINCSSNLKIIANSQPSVSNFKSFSRSLEQFFLTVGQNNFGPKKLLSICHRMKFCQIAPFMSVTVIFGLPFFFSPWGLRKSSMSEYSSGSGCRKQAHFTTRSKKPTATSMPPIHKNTNLNDDKLASSLN